MTTDNISINSPLIFLIFGATGDLTKRKLLPALYRLESRSYFRKNFVVVCAAKDSRSHEEYRKEAFNHIKEFSNKKIDEKVLKKLLRRIYYHQLRFQELENYNTLKGLLNKITDNKYKNYESVYYLAAPPAFFGTIAKNLHRAGLIVRNKKRNTRIVFEKPFGFDLESARKLNRGIIRFFDERSIFRIDHYLAKELVQNILVLRFSNCIFEPIWNNRHIEHVQITVAEELGVEHRGSYYEKSGAIRDVMQNHMMQLVALTAMEAPHSFNSDDIRDEKVKLLRHIRPIKDVILGQYTDGIINEKKVAGYREEKGVAKNSATETYAAAKLEIDNLRWASVPFYLRTGKRLKRRTTEVIINFKKTPCNLFHKDRELDSNKLVIRVQPDEGISIQFNTKVPGNKIDIEPATMDFCHACKYGPNTPEAYERLILDAIGGDQTLFTRWDEVENEWRVFDSFLKKMKRDMKGKKAEPFMYKAGTWGPSQAEKLIKKEKHEWIEPLKPYYA